MVGFPDSFINIIKLSNNMIYLFIGANQNVSLGLFQILIKLNYIKIRNIFLDIIICNINVDENLQTLIIT